MPQPPNEIRNTHFEIHISEHTLRGAGLILIFPFGHPDPMRPPETTFVSPPKPGARSLPNSARLEGFELQCVIAERSAAVVYLATDLALRMPVAIKEYMPQRLARRDAPSRVVPLSQAQVASFERGLRAFVEEARTLARCEHPSLVRVVRLIEANGTAYSVMPHYVGRPLTDVRRGTGAALDEASLRALLGSLLDALEVFHRIGGVHGGVAPDNILLLRDERPLLLGPGAVSHEVADDRIEALMAYLKASTERSGAAADWPTGPWTDLYALAKVARFCITGTLSEVATSAVDSAADEPLGELVQRMTHAAARPQYTAAFLDALDAAASPLSHQRPQSVAQFREWLAGASGLPTAVRMALRDSRPDPGLSTEPVTPAMPDMEPKFVEERIPLEDELGDATRRVAGEQGTKPESQAPDAHETHKAHKAHEAPAMPAFNPGPRRRRRIGVWSGLAVGLISALALVGAWMFNQQPVRIDGWAQGLAAITPGPAGRAANPVATARVGSPIAAASSIAGAAASGVDGADGADGAGVAAIAPAVTSALEAPAESQAAASVPASLAPTHHTQQTKRATRAAAPRRAVAQEPSGPREACAGRTQFALYRCMRTQCGQSRWTRHAQCERLRATDEVD